MTYRAYGRTIASDRPLPELDTTKAAADITVTWDSHTHVADGTRWTTLWRFSTGEPWVTTARAKGVRHLRFGRFADVALSDRRIELSRRGHATNATLRHLLLDQALPLALAAEGALVVHASALASGGRAILLAGRAGAGKSTLAAFLAREGMRVIADDGALLEGRSPELRVVASYPGLRVYRDSAEAAGLDLAPAGDVAEYSCKVRVRPPRHSHDGGLEPPTLVTMYSLVRGESAVRLERLSRRDAAIEVLAHAYRIDLHDRPALEAQLDVIARAGLDVWRASYPRDLARAGEVASAIAVHARGLGL